MDHKPYTVQGLLEAKPGKEQELEEMLTSLIEPSLQESGCINYDLHQCISNPALFMFYENWVDEEAFLKHIESPHIKSWSAKKEELLAKPNEVTFWQIIN